MPRRSRISDEDRALFRDAVAGAKRLQPDGGHEKKAKLPKPVPRQREADERAVMDELAAALPDLDDETGEELSWRTPGLQDSVMRKLRRGQFRIDRSLDLHGFTSATAKVEVASLVKRAQDDGAQCVRIVHGKGRGSREGKAVLKQRVSVWLRHHKEVLAFVSARPQDGGTGAVLVLLKRKR